MISFEKVHSSKDNNEEAHAKAQYKGIMLI